MAENSAIEKIFNSKKIKYSNLDTLNLKTKSSGVNIILDFYWILGQLANSYVSELIAETTPQILVAEMFNLLAHYRAYFAKYHGVETFFYIPYSFDFPEGLPEGYKSERIEKLQDCHENIHEFVKQFRLVSKFFDDIYVINMKTSDTDGFIDYFYQYAYTNKIKRTTYVISSSFLFQASALQSYKVLDIRNNEKFLLFETLYDEAFLTEHVNAKKFEAIREKILPEGLNNIDYFQYFVLYAMIYGDKKYSLQKQVTSIKQVTESFVNDLSETEEFLKYGFITAEEFVRISKRIIQVENSSKLDEESLRELNLANYRSSFISKKILNEVNFNYGDD
jgi:hypothetical protein